MKENIVWEIFYKLKTWSRYLSNNTICWIGLGLYLSDLVYIFLLKIMMKNKSKKEIINKLQWIWQIKIKLNYDDVFTFNCEIMYQIETCYQNIYIYIYISNRNLVCWRISIWEAWPHFCYCHCCQFLRKWISRVS